MTEACLSGRLVVDMDEREGCAVLEACFRRAGLAIERDYLFHDGELRVTLDGYDPVARVGYEFITTAAGDRVEFTPAAVAALEARMAAEELFVFLVDETFVDRPSALQSSAEAFLSLLRDRGKLP